MGDRISISFADECGESVALFSHWGGRGFRELVDEYIAELKEEQEQKGKGSCYPLDRMEAATVMVDFIRWLTKDEQRIASNYYLGKDGTDGDNSDNGHWVFDLPLGKWRH